MTCSFSKEFSATAYTGVDNAFIFEYMPNASGDAVKVYLYGLFLCSNPKYDQTAADIAKTLDLTEECVADAFKFWEDMGLCSVISLDPLSVQYMPVRNYGKTSAKPRKYKTEKYSEFTNGVQTMITSRMISTGEYTEYFNIMETYGIKPEAMLMIIKYCVDKKGNDISYRYVSKVAKDFGGRGIVTVENVEKELSSYVLRTSEIQKILNAMQIRRMPDIDDLNYYKKWTNDLDFETDNIVYAASKLKKPNVEKLDGFLMELYSMKSFSKQEIADYIDKKQSLFDLAVKINRALSVYVEVVETVVDVYVKKWLSYGFTEETLLFVASYCFKSGTNTLPQMDELIEALRKQGVVDLSSVSDYFETQSKTDEFIEKMLRTAGVNRRPTPWDKDNLVIWKGWNFSEEMIMEAAKLAAGKNSPTAYMNGILSNWKNNGVFTPSAISDKAPNASADSQEAYNNEYERRRTIAVSRAQKNVNSAMELTGFSSIYERLFGIEKDMAFAEISGNAAALAELEKEKADLQNNANALLKQIRLSLDDLSPKYACDKCHDTGYVGTHRCDCYDKTV